MINERQNDKCKNVPLADQHQQEQQTTKNDIKFINLNSKNEIC